MSNGAFAIEKNTFGPLSWLMTDIWRGHDRSRALKANGADFASTIVSLRCRSAVSPLAAFGLLSFI